MQGKQILVGDVLIFGTSGFAREVRDIVYALGRSAGFIARDNFEREQSALDRVIVESELQNFSDHQFAIGIGDNKTRKIVAERYAKKLNFPNLIHPSATFGFKQQELIDGSKGNIICAGCRFMSNITIGNFSVFDMNSTIGHDSIIASYVHIAPGANISGNVHIAEGVWVGANAAINQGTSAQKRMIGRNTVIGSGAVVTKDCDPDSTYIGVPAKRRS
jgi:sugar O-acyltransferase (sialic acid O-acetyltransferase NeuD family)